MSAGRKVTLVLLLLGFAVPSAYGQATYGSIFGTVTDPAGAVIPSARVTVTSVDRGTVYTTAANESGNYSQTQLVPGEYKVEFEASGFRRLVQSSIMVGVDRATRLDAQLTVGEVTQEVTVTSTAPALVVDRAEVSASLVSNQVRELPTLNRNFTALQLMMPGAQKTPWQHASSENPQLGMQINTNGQRFGSNNFMIDGTDNNDPVLGIIIVNPAIDSVAEFKYTTGNYDAEFAQAGGAVMQVDVKSGTNEFHGSAFEFLQNNIMNARNSFSEPKGPPPLRWNQFGGSLGGPIRKNKIFAFGDYQGTRRRTGASVLTTTPTQAMRNGDFSAFGVPIFDPSSGDPNGSGRVQFNQNTIPPSKITSQAKSLLALLPSPNYGSPGAFNNNFIASASELFDSDQFDIKVDHTATDKFRYFGRYTYASFLKISPPAFGPVAGGPGLSGLNFAGKSDTRNQNLVGGFNTVLNPTFLTDFRFGYSRYRVNVLPLDYGTNAGQAAGIPGVNLPNRPDTSGLPSFDIQGNGGFREGFSLTVNQCNCPLDEREYVLQFVNNWTKIRSNHTFKWGADIRRAQNRRIPSDWHRAGEFTFAPTVTGSADVAGSGLGPAAFLLGMPSNFRRYAQTSTDNEDMQWRMFYFVQDTWRVTPKLTLSLGLRWDTWFPNISIHAGQGSRYDLPLNAFLIAGVGNNSKAAGVETQWRNLSPRFAIAYQLNSKTVIRTGWGRSYYQEIFGATFNNIANGYPSLIQENLPQTNPYTAVFTLAQGPPTSVFPTVPSNGILPLPINISAGYIPPNLKYSNVDSWNFSVERLIGGDWTATASYVANVGRHEQLGIPLNVAVPGPGPFNPRRPYYVKYGIPQSITDSSDALSNNYNSLQTKLTKRFSAGFSLLASYTFSKSIDSSGQPPWLTMKVNRAVMDWDRTHVLSVGHTWELPFGKGRRYLTNLTGAKRYLIEGWEFTGITQAQSGLPFSPTMNNNSSINSDIGLRPDVVPGADPYNVPGGKSRNLWFNPAAYKTPGPYLFGNAGRNTLRGPNLVSMDWALFKNFEISERKRLQLRWETFNTFNRTNLGNPNGAIDAGPGSAGVITGLFIPMRQMQLGLRFEF